MRSSHLSILASLMCFLGIVGTVHERCVAQITGAGAGVRIEFSSGFPPFTIPPGFVTTGIQGIGPGGSVFLQRFHFAPQGYAEGGTALGLLVPNPFAYWFAVPTNSYLFQQRFQGCGPGSLPASMRIRFDAQFHTGPAGFPAHFATLLYPVVGRNGLGAGSFTAFEASLMFGFRDPFPGAPIIHTGNLVIRYVDRRPGAFFSVLPFTQGLVPATPPGRDFLVWGDIRFTVRGCPFLAAVPVEMGGGEVAVRIPAPAPPNDPTIAKIFVDADLIMDMEPFPIVDENGPEIEIVEMIEGNHRPVLAPIGSISTEVGFGISFVALASDANKSDKLTFSLGGDPPAGASITPQGVFDFLPASEGMYEVTVVVTDNGNPSQLDHETVVITVGGPQNHAPSLDAVAPIIVSELDAVAVPLHAVDPDSGDQLTFSLEGVAPSWVSVDPGGTLVIAPSEADAPDVVNVTIRVTDDGVPALWHQQQVSIQAVEVNQPPIIDPVPPIVTMPNQPVVFTVSATDGDSKPGPDPKNPILPLEFRLEGAPSGAAIDSLTGEFFWTPTHAHAGKHHFQVVVTDVLGASAATGITILVEVNPTDRLSTPRSRSGSE